MRRRHVNAHGQPEFEVPGAIAGRLHGVFHVVFHHIRLRGLGHMRQLLTGACNPVVLSSMKHVLAWLFVVCLPAC